MKQIVLASILAITFMPALSFADNDSMPKPPKPPMGSGAMMGNGMMHDYRNDNGNPKMPRPPMGSGAMMGSGMKNEGRTPMPKPPKPPMGSGAMMGSGMGMNSGVMVDRDTDGLKKAMEKLTPEQRLELAKMIRTFLESKGIQLPTPSENKEQIKEVRNEMKENAKALREQTQEEIKMQRDVMKEKIKFLKKKD